MTTIDNRVANWGSPAELARAADELRVYANTVSRDLRAANAAARALNPLHGFRSRSRTSRDAVAGITKTLPADAQTTIAAATALKEYRTVVGEAGRALTDPDGLLLAHHANQILARLPEGQAPTWRAVVARWQDARRAAGVVDGDPPREALEAKFAQILAKLDRRHRR